MAISFDNRKSLALIHALANGRRGGRYETVNEIKQNWCHVKWTALTPKRGKFYANTYAAYVEMHLLLHSLAQDGNGNNVHGNKDTMNHKQLVKVANKMTKRGRLVSI